MECKILPFETAEKSKKLENCNKKRERYIRNIQNQKSEIALLLRQKEEIQNKLNMANNTVCGHYDYINKLEGTISKQNTIIEYLESKLNG